MIEAILFTAIVPLALLLVFAFNLLGGRLSGTMRKRVERGLTLLIYPAIMLSGAWWARENYEESDWSGFAMMLLFVGVFGFQFVVALRSRTLFPRYGHPKA